MTPTTEQLKARWTTSDGKNRLEDVKKAINAKRMWSSILKGFPENHYLKDLRGADLNGVMLDGADLSQAYLTGADLTGAVLFRANLFRANLTGAVLRKAFFFRADLTEADLTGADLREANLSQADLTGADLSQANLSQADLSQADLTGADLTGADLREANLFRANLTGAVLRKAFFFRADLTEADLTGANLIGANLISSCLDHASLLETYLTECQLVKSSLKGADISGAKLYGTSRDDWVIQGIRCTHIFWDNEHEKRTPADRYFEPGEFERLYASLPTIEYVFQHGMAPLDPLIMDRVTQSIRKRLPQFDIKVDSINARGLLPSIKFTVRYEEQKAAALAEVTAVYEKKAEILQAQRDMLYELIAKKMDRPDTVNLIEAHPGSYVANDGSTINIQQHIQYISQLQKAVLDAPDETLPQVAKRKVMDILGTTLEDVARGQLKDAAKAIFELAKEFGPVIAKTTAFEFFKGQMGL